VAALRYMREQMLDLVLLDISLPDRNGIEVLKQARSEIPDLPILCSACTARTSMPCVPYGRALPAI
jgi:CheY-like chemotaxis protein